MTMNINTDKQGRYDLCTRYLADLSKAGSLMGLLDIHKKLWNDGIRHRNIGPDEFGMFRTGDIATMSPSQVFLGNVYGLWTAPLSEWIGTKDERIILEQYRNHLMTNVDWLRSLIFDNGLDRAKIERTIASDAPEWAGITDVRVLDKEMRDNKLMEFTYKANGTSGKSNLIVMTISPKTDLLLVPRNWHRGEHISSKFHVGRIGQWKDLGFKDRIVSIKKNLLDKGFSVRPAEEKVNKSKQSQLKR